MTYIPLVDLHASYLALKKDLDLAIQKVIESSSFILGPEVSNFEKNFASFCKAKYCVGVDSGLSALELGMRALGIGPGDEVLTPANSFIASSSAISFTGAKPVWVDIEANTYNIDPDLIEKKITQKTKAIMVVHLYGLPARMDKITKIAKTHKLLLIEDAAQAHGAAYKGKKVGSFGEFAAFSFYPAKNLGAFGDAGAIVTNNKVLATTVSQMRNYGQAEKYHHKFLAYNRRMDTIQGAVLGVKLKNLEADNKKRLDAAIYYTKALQGLPIVLPEIPPECKHVFHLYVIQSPKRNRLLAYLRENRIGAQVHYPIPIYRQKAYIHKDPDGFPVTDQVSKKILSLPLYAEITKGQQDYVIEKIRAFFSK